MKRFELRIPSLVTALACLGLASACTIESHQEKDDGTGGAAAGGGGAPAGGGASNSGGAPAGGGQSNSGGSAGQAAGGAAGVPGAGGSAGAGGSGGGAALPWPVTSCSDLCQYQPVVTSDETQCVTIQAELDGYPVTSTPACTGIFSVAQCIGCYAAVKMSDADCATIGNACLK